YIGYPLLVEALSSRRNSVEKSEGVLPRVSILIAAFNEEQDIENTLRNKIELDYPRNLLEILVVSDESVDQTDAIVERIAAESPIPTCLIRQVPRQGKASGLYLIVSESSRGILVFTDAYSIYGPNVLRELIRNLTDATVGYVSGKMLY